MTALQLEKLNVKANKCLSRPGIQTDKMYMALKNRLDDGVTALQRSHEATLKRQSQRDRTLEGHLKEQGKLKILQSDQNRSQLVVAEKKPQLLDGCLKTHNKRILEEFEALTADDPKVAKQFKLEMKLGKPNYQSSFASPSRMNL